MKTKTPKTPKASAPSPRTRTSKTAQADMTTAPAAKAIPPPPPEIPALPKIARTRAPRKTPAPAGRSQAPARVVSDEDVRVRAYFLSLELRGRGLSEQDCWFLAERELRPERHQR